MRQRMGTGEWAVTDHKMLKWLKVGVYGVDTNGVYRVLKIASDSPRTMITVEWCTPDEGDDLSDVESAVTGTYNATSFLDDREATEAEVNDAILSSL